MVAISGATTTKSEDENPMIGDRCDFVERTTFSDGKFKGLFFLAFGVATGCVLAAIVVVTLLIVRGVPPCSREEFPNPESMMWTDKNIAYWSSVNPVAPSDPSDTGALRKYEEALFLRQEARLRALKCIPKNGVFTVEDLLEEDEERKSELQDILVPNQKVVLKRCLPQSSYCEVYGTKCTPTKDVRQGSKRIAVVIKNGTHNEETVIAFHVEEHLHCSCQCPCARDEV